MDKKWTKIGYKWTENGQKMDKKWTKIKPNALKNVIGGFLKMFCPKENTKINELSVFCY